MDTTRRAMAIGVSGVGVESGLCERVCTRAPHMLVRDPKSEPEWGRGTAW